MSLTSAFLLLSLLGVSTAQYPPAPCGLTSLISKLNPDVQVTYKETQLCETTPGVKAYSGYVHLPSSAISDIANYNISTYFLYFEARKNAATAPLAVWLAGGPGEASSYTAFASESGPCYVNPAGNDTILNPWSLNNHVNMLYIDQPVQTGLSYNYLVNGTIDVQDLSIYPEGETVPQNGDILLPGTFSGQDPSESLNTTTSAAKALWCFAENWLSTFPGYNTTSKRISLWGNSYGGLWVPATAHLWNQQLTTLLKNHTLHGRGLTLDAIGITNGCIDMLYSTPSYPLYAYNNTYDVQFIPEDVYQQSLQNWTKPEGCRDLIQKCRALGEQGDPTFLGNSETVNTACGTATQYCANYVIGAFDTLTDRDPFDVAVNASNPCNTFYVPVYFYLNQPSVLTSLGVPLNWTWDSNVVQNQFGAGQILATGDLFRQAGVPLVNDLLKAGVKVSMIYGDRDYRCTFFGAETTANAFTWDNQTAFQNAGYTNISGVSTGRQGLVSKQDNCRWPEYSTQVMM